MEPKIVGNSAFLRMKNKELIPDKGKLVENGEEMDLRRFTVPIRYENETVNATAYVDAASVKPCHVKARDNNGEVIMEDGVPKIAVDDKHKVVALGHPDSNIQLTLANGYDEKGRSRTRTVSMSVRDFAESISLAGLQDVIEKEHGKSSVKEDTKLEKIDLDVPIGNAKKVRDLPVYYENVPGEAAKHSSDDLKWSLDGRITPDDQTDVFKRDPILLFEDSPIRDMRVPGTGDFDGETLAHVDAKLREVPQVSGSEVEDNDMSIT